MLDIISAASNIRHTVKILTPHMAGRSPSLSRREREIMEVLWRLGSATVAEIHGELASPPSPTAVRSMLWLLEEKGHVQHEQSGPRNVYQACVPAERLRKDAVKNLVRTFFAGSRLGAVNAILGDSNARLDDEEIKSIEAMLERHKRSRDRGR